MCAEFYTWTSAYGRTREQTTQVNSNEGSPVQNLDSLVAVMPQSQDSHSSPHHCSSRIRLSVPLVFVTSFFARTSQYSGVVPPPVGTKMDE